MALKGTYLSWSDDPDGFDNLMKKDGERISHGVFVTTGPEIPEVIASVLGAKVYTVEIEVATLAVHP